MRDSGIPPREAPLPNILGYVTFAKQLLQAEAPIVGVKMMMLSGSMETSTSGPKSTKSSKGASKGIGRLSLKDASGGSTSGIEPETGPSRLAGSRKHGSSGNENGSRNKRKGKDVEGFVDIVARGGAEWIRIYR